MAAFVEGPGIAALSCGKPVYLVVLLTGGDCDAQTMVNHALNWAPTMPKAEFLAAELEDAASFDMADPAAAAEGLARLAPLLDAFLDAALAKRRLPDSHLALVGFSQGAALALHVGLRREKEPAAIVAFSGALTDLDALPAQMRAKPPILFIHGDADAVTPLSAMTATKDAAKAQGAKVKALKIPGLGHAVDDDGIIVAGDFLTQTVAHKPAAKTDDHEHEHH
jgi:phospholipase/carboxylesterase